MAGGCCGCLSVTPRELAVASVTQLHGRGHIAKAQWPGEGHLSSRMTWYARRSLRQAAQARHGDRLLDGGDQAACIGATGACQVEGGTMIDGGTDDR